MEKKQCIPLPSYDDQFNWFSTDATCIAKPTQTEILLFLHELSRLKVLKGTVSEIFHRPKLETFNIFIIKCIIERSGK
jgi:hypothetical protein